MQKRTVLIAFVLLLAICAALLPPVVRQTAAEKKEETKYIKWVDFSVSYEALSAALAADVQSHTAQGENPVEMVSVLAYLGAKYGGDFGKFKKSDLENLLKRLKEEQTTVDALGASLSTYAYFKEAYGSVLDGFVGAYSIEKENEKGDKEFENCYGLKAFSPIAKGYSFSHFDDFGNSRSYGYKRRHLGHDLMGGIGTPIVAVESGVVECLGWNQYGGWRIGIRSFDKKRYHYYAHLRKDHPYNDLYEGQIVTAGDVIGYLGMTGYSTKENVNNINTPHLHYGLQLIFDESQKDGVNQIWVDVYAITKLLEKNKSAVVKQEDGHYERRYQMFESLTEE